MIRFILIILCIFSLARVLPAQTNDQELSISANITNLTTTSPQLDTSPEKSLIHWSTHAKNIAQVFFWLTIGAVSILTYSKAKRTILQPIRTEIFKVQLEEMRAILTLFVGKSEMELRTEHALDQFFTANSFMMYDRYALTFFDLETERDKRPYCDAKCSGSLITEEGMQKHFTIVDSHLDDETAPKDREDKDPRVRAALWADYDHYELRIPNEFTELEKKIQDLLENPLLPSECVELLTEYRGVLYKNLDTAREVLTTGAKEMPDKYPTPDALKKSSFSWLQNRYNTEFEDLKPCADKITGYVRSRFDVDNLLNA